MVTKVFFYRLVRTDSDDVDVQYRVGTVDIGSPFSCGGGEFAKALREHLAEAAGWPIERCYFHALSFLYDKEDFGESSAEEEVARLRRIRNDMKEEAGYGRNVSFDVVWADLMQMLKENGGHRNG